MSDVENAYKQIASFLNNETEKTLLICGIADEEKHRTLLKALNVRGMSKGLIFLIHTTKDGMEDFFRWAGLSKVKVPKKYGQSMQLSNLTIYFDNLSTRSSSNKYDNYAFDFMIVWPMQSVMVFEYIVVCRIGGRPALMLIIGFLPEGDVFPKCHIPTSMHWHCRSRNATHGSLACFRIFLCR